MGWRRFVQLAGAASRRLEREQIRRERIVAKAEHATSTLFDRLDAQAARKVGQVAPFEEKAYRLPVDTLKVRFVLPDKWEVEPYSDHSGNINIDLSLAFTSDPVEFSKPFIDFEKRRISPVRVCCSQYATFVAFSITYNPAVSGSKATRLVSKSQPDHSLVVVRADDHFFSHLTQRSMCPWLERRADLESWRSSRLQLPSRRLISSFFQIVTIAPVTSLSGSPCRATRFHVLSSDFQTRQPYRPDSPMLHQRINEVRSTTTSELSLLKQKAKQPQGCVLVVLALATSVLALVWKVL